MSVLLEALKKAAEDKKKALDRLEPSKEEVVDPVLEKEWVPKQDALGSAQKEKNKKPSFDLQESEAESASIKLALDDTVVADPSENTKESNAEKSPPPSQKASEHDQQDALKLTLNSHNEHREPKDTSEPTNEPVKESPDKQPELKLALSDSIALKPSSIDVTPDETLVKQKKSDTSDLALVTNEPLKMEASTETTRLDFALDDHPINESAELHVVKKDAEKTFLQDEILEANQPQALDPVTAGLHSKGSNEELIDLSHSKKVVKKVEDNFETLETAAGQKAAVMNPDNLSSLKKDKLEEDSESYKWSMDSLPGYLGLGRKKTKDKTSSLNPILVSGALSESSNRRSKQVSFKLVLILLMILAFIGIMFYGILYYQEQYKQLESHMKKYNLVKTQIAVKEVATPDKAIENTVNRPVVDEGLNQSGLDEGDAGETSLKATNSSTVKSNEQSSVHDEVDTGSQSNTNKFDDTGTSNKQSSVASQTISNSKSSIVGERLKHTDIAVDDKTVSNVVKDTSVKTIKPSGNAVNSGLGNVTVVVHSEKEVLSEAYLNYEEGDYSQAKQSFERVLNMNPGNEFALIGLGNIAVTEQQYLTAMDYYQMALVAQPSSLNAFEAIANIAGHVELNSEWKTSLLEMVQDYPDSATLQYALGNLYAREQDWLAAQAAYFQAVSLEHGKADYIMNLAVSLDQLGQYTLAAQYYAEALSLVDMQTVNFDEAQVKNRLISIRQFIAGENQ